MNLLLFFIGRRIILIFKKILQRLSGPKAQTQSPPKFQTRARKAIRQPKKQRPQKRKYRYSPNQTPKTPPNHRNPTRKHLLLQIQQQAKPKQKPNTANTPRSTISLKEPKNETLKPKIEPASPSLDHKQLQKTREQRDKVELKLQRKRYTFFQTSIHHLTSLLNQHRVSVTNV